MLRVLNAEYDQLMVMARMNVGALRSHVHLRRRRTGFSTMVGEQPWSNHPLVDLLDRTQQFIGRKGASGSSRSFAECLQRFRLGCIASQANVCCRNHSIGNWEPPPGCAKICVYNFASVPGDPIIGLRSKCPRQRCWRATQASSHLDLKLPQKPSSKGSCSWVWLSDLGHEKFRKPSLDGVFLLFFELTFRGDQQPVRLVWPPVGNNCGGPATVEQSPTCWIEFWNRTYFIVPAFALGLKTGIACLWDAGPGGAACPANVCCRSHTIEITESCIQYVQRAVPNLLSKFQEIRKLWQQSIQDSLLIWKLLALKPFETQIWYGLAFLRQAAYMSAKGCSRDLRASPHCVLFLRIECIMCGTWWWSWWY